MNPNDTTARPDENGLDRREFLRLSGVLAAAGALGSAACSPPQEATVPFHDMPESLVDGMGPARFFHTVVDGSPVLVKTREGRPILVAPTPGDASGRGLSVRHHAALMDVYDPDRARGPISVRRGKGAPVASSWTAIGNDVVSRLKTAGPKAVLLARPIDSPSVMAAIAALSAKTGLRHVAWAPLGDEAAATAWQQAFGEAKVLRPRLDKADLVVGLGADFLDRPEDGFEREFAARRSPEGMGRFVQLEGRLTLTGANADRRIRIRDSHLAIVAAGLAHELIVVRKLGPLASVTEIGAALAPYAIDGVAKQVGLDAAILKGVADELGKSVGKAVVVSGRLARSSSSGPGLELATILLDVTLGAFEAGLFEEGGTATAPGSAAAFAALTADMLAGKVDVLIVAGPNPVYDTPASLKFADALAKVPFVLSMNDRLDETSALADTLAPLSHPFECWSDAALPKGIVAVQQPVIQPLFDTRGFLDVLVEWAAAIGDPAAQDAVATAAKGIKVVPPANSATPAPSPSLAFHYLRAAWAVRLGVAPATPAFDTAWNEVLRAGAWKAVVETAAATSKGAAAPAKKQAPGASVGIQRSAEGLPGASVGVQRSAEGLPGASVGAQRLAEGLPGASVGVQRSAEGLPGASVGIQRSAEGLPGASVGIQRSAQGFSPALTSLSLLSSIAPKSGELELQLYPHLALADGRGGNNGWLHELPDPITRLTWGGAVSIAPRRFDEMKLANGDLVEVDAGHAKIVAPAYRHAGMHHDQVALPLGLGRAACGVIGNGVGPNAFPLRLVADGRIVSTGLPVKIRKVGGKEELAFGQGAEVIDRDRRPLVPTTTLTAYEKDHTSGTEQDAGGASAWPTHEYPKARWAMAIDLSKCNGCGKCVIGCQAENNIPVVGRHGMLNGRAMSWIRIDRYYDAPKKDGGWDADVWDGPLAVVEEPSTLFQPMLCQHCENAPCETVCPFVATMHSEDGVNQQVYNRCVGTRYCANNCPFKVRRFNFWEYSKAQESSFFRWLEPRIAKNAELNARAPMQMKNNPEVTVRSRGVMEKCSFCIQRIRAARSEATREGKGKDHFADGAVVTACMEACPTNAIVFGDVNAPGAKVAALAAEPRAMKLLESVGVKPSISYLARVRNDKA